MTRRDPFRELFELSFPSSVAQMFESPLGPEAGSWLPPLDVYETREAFVVTVDVPGVTPSKLDVTLETGVLTVKGERKFYSNVSEDSFHRVERRFGMFNRAVALPSAKVDPDGVSARIADGVLTVEIPKAQRAQPRRIEVVEEQVIETIPTAKSSQRDASQEA